MPSGFSLEFFIIFNYAEREFHANCMGELPYQVNCLPAERARHGRGDRFHLHPPSLRLRWAGSRCSAGHTHFMSIGAETRNEGGFWARKCCFIGIFEDFGWRGWKRGYLDKRDKMDRMRARWDSVGVGRRARAGGVSRGPNELDLSIRPNCCARGHSIWKAIEW